jgi:hypothetical protein
MNSLYYPVFLIILNIYSLIDLQNESALPYLIDIKKNIDNLNFVNLSNLGNELIYLPLQTAPECLIKNISKIEFSDSYIFVSEINRLLQFDKNGNFLRQIGSVGRGPGEYLAVSDFCVDNDSHEIFIISSGQLLVFDFEGKFRNSYKLTFRPSQIIPLSNNKLMYHLFNIPGPNFRNEHSWIITDRKGGILMKMKNNLERVSQPGLIVKNSPLYLFNDAVHFLEFGIDTLYFFQGELKKPYSIFDLGNLKMSPDPLTAQATIDKVSQQLKNKMWINMVNENSDFLFVKITVGLTDSSLYAAYDKKKHELKILENNGFKNDLDGGMNFWPKYIYNDNILVSYIDAFDLMKIIKKIQLEAKQRKGKNIAPQLLYLSKQLTETSNPVLMILK